MADTEKTSAQTKPSNSTPPESPTTARPLDFDDDAQEPLPQTASHTETTSTSKRVPTEDTPPAKPPRPLNPREQAELTLKEAFPSIDVAVVKMALAASGGQVEQAFNALLGMSDPDSQREPDPPAKPPRPSQQYGVQTSTTQSQLEADELYARQLAEHYSGGERQQTRQTSPGLGRQTQPSNQNWRVDSGTEDQERSFIDGWSDNAINRAIIDSLPPDDLPVIRENIRKGFLETQSTVNKWIGNLRKKLEGDDDEDFSSQPPRPAQGYSGRPQSFGRQSGEMRRSADRERYDADPELIDDDFTKLELRDAESPPPKRPTRPLANPDLFKPTPQTPNTRKVSFQDGPPEEIRDMYSASPPPTSNPSKTTSGGKPSKWQPLSMVEPSPVTENDPFSLGDSDDDKDAKSKDIKEEEQERLQKATSEAMAETIGDSAKSDSGAAKS